MPFLSPVPWWLTASLSITALLAACYALAVRRYYTGMGRAGVALLVVSVTVVVSQLPWPWWLKVPLNLTCPVVALASVVFVRRARIRALLPPPRPPRRTPVPPPPRDGRLPPWTTYN